MSSIFDRIYSYRARENKDSKENFLIEIFAFCLQTDELFFKSFSNLCNVKISKKKYSIWGSPILNTRGWRNVWAGGVWGKSGKGTIMTFLQLKLKKWLFENESGWK